MKVGDLVKLKGFKITNQNEVPHGVISADFGLGKVKVMWLNEEVAATWALSKMMDTDKLEVINSVDD